MKKKFIAILLVLTSAITLFGCSKSDSKVFNIYCWNNEFYKLFLNYYPDVDKEKSGEAGGTDYLKDGTKIVWTEVANKDNAYQNALDAALPETGAKKAVDMFLVEADYALKYVNGSYAEDVKGVIGLTDTDLANQYKYTQDIVTDSNGVLKGVSWQACPGLFAYRRSIANDVLGSDDPDTVQAAIADWDKFNALAPTMKTAGYKMLSGYDDSYRAFSNNITTKLVDSSDIIQMESNPQINAWIDQTKTFTTNEYNNKSILWDTQWAADQGEGGDVFGYFYSTWGINFSLKGYAIKDTEAAEELGNGTYGDWAVCQGPASYYWGGSWLCAAKSTDQPELVKDIMKAFTCNSEIMTQITKDTLDFTNNKPAMVALGNDATFGPANCGIIGGQNHISLFVAAADKIAMDYTSPYDQGLNENIQTAMHDYFAGTVDKATAWANFYTKIATVYPELKKPSNN